MRESRPCRDGVVPTQVSSKEVLDYLGFRDSKFMHAAFQLLGEPWDGSRMDFGETVKCIAQFCMCARGVLTCCGAFTLST